MAKTKAQISVSLDGYVAGADQSEENPLGVGGQDLHQWVVKLASWRGQHGHEGGEGAENPSDAVLTAATEDIGAVVMGRNMFGPVRDEWGDSDWNGWWGDDPPFHTPVFVLTHHPREPLVMDGGTTFHFVTDGLEAAIEQAHKLADGRDVSIGGGASTLQQCIAGGHLDELLVNQVPVLLGAGERLFDQLDAGAATFELAEVVRGREALHLTYRITA